MGEATKPKAICTVSIQGRDTELYTKGNEYEILEEGKFGIGLRDNLKCIHFLDDKLFRQHFKKEA